MSRVTLPNKKNYDKKPIRERERELRREIDEKHAQEPYEFTKKDILAMIIAAYQMIMPIVLIGVVTLIVVAFVFLKVYQ